MANKLTRAVAGVQEWFNYRTPGLLPAYRKHMSEYWAPKNFNLWYYFGSLALLVLVNQIVTGIFLTMNFKPSAAEAFASVEYIMRDVEWGWLIRYMHSTGASAFFIVVYLHMFRGLLYGSAQKPRELVWILGMLIYLVLMAEAFMGYVLPWGQMSFWGAKVIISLFGAIPMIGDTLVEWIMGDYLPADATLNRFFALHVIALPLVLLLLVVLHIAALHEVGSNNPDGVDIKKTKDARGRPLDGIAFHPYYTVKDIFGCLFFLTICAFVLFFEPTFGGWFLEHDNFVAANKLVTPEHIKPVWYYTPYYAMLRVVPDKLFGVLTMFGAIAILFFVPWLDRSPVKSYRYRGWMSKVLLGLFAFSFVWLGKIGAGPGTDPVETIVGRVLTLYYFAFFFTMPFWTAADATKQVPERVTMHD
ncbi:MAG TPA: cytochrome bc complex cytochrome b subunit [Tahibacter sp.]|uniref:Cytochrome b n=1 Tax=Tahibacter soli TaxID=2983605 RepID=A0A9X4BJA7_9GAMM|nr:cytochrome bc complex cytochrome b subunit [Tahibacter soli]MDC8011969.1 cytochrome bc complex cytochrome b subunit [Tahibacter soli]HVJ63101.1 cytochrome bc complex cytochrome b subunit [Tahibacter sp.]